MSWCSLCSLSYCCNSAFKLSTSIERDPVRDLVGAHCSACLLVKRVTFLRIGSVLTLVTVRIGRHIEHMQGRVESCYSDIVAKPRQFRITVVLSCT